MTKHTHTVLLLLLAKTVHLIIVKPIENTCLLDHQTSKVTDFLWGTEWTSVKIKYKVKDAFASMPKRGDHSRTPNVRLDIGYLYKFFWYLGLKTLKVIQAMLYEGHLLQF